MTATRIPEFITQLRKIACKTLDLTQSTQWRENRELLDNSSLDNKLRGEKIAALQVLTKSLGKRRVNQLNALEKLCVSELVYLFSEHTINTVAKTDIPAYRKGIENNLGARHPSLAFFRMNKVERNKMNATYTKEVKERQGERAFYDVDGFINTAKNLLQSDSYIDVAMGLCAVTGRRPGEILISAKFSETTDRLIKFGDNEIEIDEGVIFSGQMKTKGAKDARDNYLIPTLVNSDFVVQSLAKLRMLKNFEGKTGKQVNNVSAKSQNLCVKREFSEHFDGNVKPYDLRHAYVLICASRYCNNPNQYPKLFSEILGHRQDDLATKDSYMTLKIG